MTLSARFSTLVCAVTLASLPARADMTLEERMTVEGTGLMSMANMTGHSVTTVASDRARIETDIQVQSKLVKMFAGNSGPTAEIIRLDQEKVYDLNLKKKQYTEVTFEQRRAALQKAVEQSQQAQAQGTAGGGLDESQCEWSEPKASVKKTGEIANFAGYDAERVQIVGTQSCRNKQTGAVCEVGIALDEWLSTGFAGGNETTQFYKAYAEKMGYSTSLSKDVAQRAETLFGRYRGIWQEVGKQMGDVKGYPVKATFGLGIGGPQCQSSQQDGTATADGAAPQTPSSEDAQKAAATAAGEVAGQTAAQEAGKSTFGGLAGQLGGKLAGSLFSKKKEEPAAAAAAATPPPPSLLPGGLVPMLTLTTELVSVKRDPAAPGTFEVPAGFTKATD